MKKSDIYYFRLCAGIDLLQANNGALIAKVPTYALDISLWLWNSRRLNRYADPTDLRAITRRINGEYNDRQNYLNQTHEKFIFSTQHSIY